MLKRCYCYSITSHYSTVPFFSSYSLFGKCFPNLFSHSRASAQYVAKPLGNLTPPVSYRSLLLAAISCSIALRWSSFHAHTHWKNWCFIHKAPPACHASVSRGASCSNTTFPSGVKRHWSHGSVRLWITKENYYLPRKSSSCCYNSRAF